MPIYLQNKASYSRLLAGDGTEITDTSGKLDVNIASGEVAQDTHDSLNCNANLQVGDADVSSSNKVPVSGTFNPATVGTHANAFNSASPTIDGTSATIDCQYVKRISVFGQESTASPTITIQVSQDDINWFDSNHSLYTTGGSDFYAEFEVGARYVRLKVSATCTAITATIAGKQ